MAKATNTELVDQVGLLELEKEELVTLHEVEIKKVTKKLVEGEAELKRILNELASEQAKNAKPLELPKTTGMSIEQLRDELQKEIRGIREVLSRHLLNKGVADPNDPEVSTEGRNDVAGGVYRDANGKGWHNSAGNACDKRGKPLKE